MPFIVAPFNNFQDTMVLGPQSVSDKHDDFINALYGQIKSLRLERIAARAFIFQDKICISLMFPTQVADAGGRKGLMITLGFLTNRKIFEDNGLVFSEYFELIFKVLNNHLNLHLPNFGMDQLIKDLNDPSDYIYDKFQSTLDTLLFASKIIRIKTSTWSFQLFYRKPKTPKVIYYGGIVDKGNIIDIFLNEVGRFLHRCDIMAIQESSVTQEDNKQIISILPMPYNIASANSITIGKYAKGVYIRIY